VEGYVVEVGDYLVDCLRRCAEDVSVRRQRWLPWSVVRYILGSQAIFENALNEDILVVEEKHCGSAESGNVYSSSCGLVGQ